MSAGADQRQLYILLVRNIAEAVVEYARCSGETGAVFDDGCISKWEWACDILCDLGVSEPLAIDPVTNELAPCEKREASYAYRFRMDVSSVADFLKAQPVPDNPSFDQILSVWLEIHDYAIPTTRKPFQFPRLSLAMEPEKIEAALKREPQTVKEREAWARLCIAHVFDQKILKNKARIKLVLNDLTNIGYVKRKGASYLWTDMAAGAMTAKPLMAWQDDLTAFEDRRGRRWILFLRRLHQKTRSQSLKRLDRFRQHLLRIFARRDP